MLRIARFLFFIRQIFLDECNVLELFKLPGIFLEKFRFTYRIIIGIYSVMSQGHY